MRIIKTASTLTWLAFVLAFSSEANAECRLDWNGDGKVTVEDLVDDETLGGFYNEWHTYVNDRGQYQSISRS